MSRCKQKSPVNSRTVRVTSVFPAGADAVWERLQRLDTLRYIARPYATFDPLKNTSLVWRQGETSRFALRLFGIFYIGVHTINVVKFDRDTLTIQTREGNNRVPVWNHKIVLKRQGAAKTQYTDTVEIFAGWATPIVYAWGVMFYRHRQRKWRKLLKGAAR